MCELWKSSYEAQRNEQKSDQSLFPNEKPSLRPASPFHPAEDAEALRKAMKGLGTNEDEIIRILTRRTLSQRIEIQDKYQQIHGRDLVKDLKSELKGNFEKVILSLLKPLPIFNAEQIKQATARMGTDDSALIEIICTKDDASLRILKEVYEKEYDITLEKVVRKETKDHFETILLSLLDVNRDDSASDPSDVAKELANEDIDDDDIIKIMTSYTFGFLKKVFKEYKEKTEKDFLHVIDKEFSGHSKEALETIYSFSKNRREYFAYALNKAMKGFGTDEWALIRIIVSRCEIDLETIKEKYAILFEKDLVEQVKKEQSGDCEKALVNLLGGTTE